MTIFFISIVVAFIAYYFVIVAKKPSLLFQKNAFNNALVESTTILKRRFFPTPWLFNTHLQLIVLGFIKGFAKPLKYDQQDILTMPDGGKVSVDWLGLDLPEDTPTMLVLHTISGNPQSMRGFVRYIRKNLGWRVALCVRRGHGELALTTANFNTMGNVEDFAAQINHIQTQFPHSDLYATGISAGSGVLAHYLGVAGKNTPIKAAMAYCPAYDMRNAFSRAKPFYSKMMAKKLKKLFISPNEDVIKHLETFDVLNNSIDLHEFHQHLYELAGNSSTEEYMKKSNPSEVFEGIKIPILILNSKDDPVCHIENVYEHLDRMQRMDNLILVITDRGSHCAYLEGFTAKSWANRMIKDYFLSVSRLSIDD